MDQPTPQTLDVPPKSEGSSGARLGANRALGVVAAVLALGMVSLGVLLAIVVLTRPRHYDTSTPEAVLVSAREMVERGDTERLPELLYAEDERWELVYRQLSALMGALEDLSDAVGEAYPDEIAALQDAFAQADATGGPTPFLRRLRDASRSNGDGGPVFGPFASGPVAEALEGVFTRVFTDPYGFVRESEARVSFVDVDDETVAILWDGQTVLPPFGMVMRRVEDEEDGVGWRVVPPTNVPAARRFLPQNDAEFAVLGSIVQVAYNTVSELEDEVRAGKHADLKQLGDAAIAKTTMPAMLCFVAYGRAMEARED